MASISNQTNGRKLIQFVAPDRNRKTIRLGKTSRRSAEVVKTKVESLVSAQLSGHAVDDETARWLASANPIMLDKLAAVGLIPPKEQSTLGSFLDAYIATRTDVKHSTITIWSHTRRNLLAFFGQGKPLRDITPGDADEWRLDLIEQGLADNTVRRRCGIAKQFFTAAVRKGLISRNPFRELVAAITANTTREYFVTRKEIERVIDACPDAQWRLILALSRYAGLRCPSEHLTMRWSDIDWEHGRVTIRSPKTEHHPNGGVRVIPLFPELRPYLQQVFDEADDGAEFVITRYRNTNANLRTQLLKIIVRAGLEPWPKLFQNLRSSRETELADEFPMHVACAWIGNSQLVAMKHYLQITDDHFARASGEKEALQNALQQSAVRGRKAKQGKTRESANRPRCNALQNDANPCDDRDLQAMGATGLEPVTSAV